MTRSTCPLCGAAEIAAFRDIDHRNLGRCRGCSHVFAREYDPAEVESFYRTGYYASADDPRIRNWAMQKAGTWRALLSDIERRQEPLRDLLDVGAGTGGFLEVVSEQSPSTALYAVESSENARESVHTRIPGVRFPAATAEELAGIDLRVDCVVLLQCLEHVEEPLDLLRVVRERLRDGGLLLVTVPNRHSYRVLLRGTKEKLCLGNPTHLHFFTRRPLARALAEAGFAGVERLAEYGTGEYTGPKALLQWFLRRAALSSELRYVARRPADD